MKSSGQKKQGSYRENCPHDLELGKFLIRNGFCIFSFRMCTIMTGILGRGLISGENKVKRKQK